MINLKFLVLEDRIVLDAALLAGLSDPSESSGQPSDADSQQAVTPNPVSTSAVRADGVHVLVVSSAIDDLNTFVNASNVETVVYDAASASFDDVLAAVSAKLNGRMADSIAFATEGQAERFNLTNALVVDSASLSDSAMQQFWSGMGAFVKDGGRVDLLSCNFTQFSSDVADTIDALLDSSGKTVSLAASSDLTGNTADSPASDWVLERGAIDASYYFDAAKISNWHDSLATFVVTSKADSGAGTLRTAIASANSAAGTDTITFNITGTADFTNAGQNGYIITAATALPNITGRTIINGYTQAGSAAGTATSNAVILIELRGATGLNASGLTLSGSGSSGSEIHGLAINSFAGTGTNGNAIHITIGSGNNWISGNILGLDAAGTLDLGIGNHGIRDSGLGSNIIGYGGNDIAGYTSNRFADRNIISGNNGSGIGTVSGASPNLGNGDKVYGNYIGLDITGSIAIGNTTAGIDSQSVITIGGSSLNERNIISGSLGRGILLQLNSAGSVVKGNIIGLDATGTVDRGNNTSGIEITTANNIIGGILTLGVDGKLSGEGNLISGNNGAGILISAANNTIIGNIIGLDVTGKIARGNGGTGGSINDGIRLSTNASGNRIGTSSSTGAITAGEGNIISGNTQHGINFTAGTATGNTIKGNVIGLDISGTVDLGNASAGINFTNLASAVTGNTQIGGAGYLTKNANGQFVGAGNLISGNNRQGIFIGANFNQNIIQGNIVGLDITGKVDRGNFSEGIRIESSNNKVGNDGLGSDVSEGNLVSGNDLNGIYVTGGTGNTVKGNVVGLDINGTTALGNAGSGILLSGTGNTVGGVLVMGAASCDCNVISGNNGNGITLTGSNNTVIGNIIGLDVTGKIDIGNTLAGILFAGASNIRVGTSSSTGVITAGEGNIISGNDGDGIFFNAFTTNTGNLIQGNVIGLDVTGTVNLGNDFAGINFQDSTNPLTGNNQIGGAGYLTKNANGQFIGAGNLISGNLNQGILIGANFNQNIIQGNIIGLDITGTVDRGNFSEGISIASSNNKVGNDGLGSDVGEGNLISGNNSDGIYLTGTGNTVKGNVIGLGIDGLTKLGNSGNGIFIQGAGNTVGGVLVSGAASCDCNVISGNSVNGILITSANNTIIGNIIGLDATGTIARGNGVIGFNTDGIQLGTNASGNLIGTSSSTGVITAGEGNIISGNLRNGISFGATNASSTNTGNIIQGNVIGLDISGTIDLGNSASGISTGTLSSATILNNQIGGAGYLTKNANGQFVGAGNLISGNNANGIFLGANFNQNKIQGNIIGLDITGKVDLGNTSNGIDIGSSNNKIGNDGIGSDLGEGNLISGNNGDGIILRSGTGNTVKGNIIGLNIDGTQDGANDLGNSLLGIEIFTSSGNTVGGILMVGVDGKLTGDGNVISGNSAMGILITSANNTIIGNIIGLDATGTIAIGNGTVGSTNSDGIQLGTNASGNLIGTSSSTGVITAGEGNIISGNLRNGISFTVSTNTGNIIQGNVIGLDISGTIDLGNSSSGINASALASAAILNNQIGGAGYLTKNANGQFVGAGNLISGNNTDGITIGANFNQNKIQGNIIGLDITGKVDLGNTSDGIDITSANNKIGNDGIGSDVGEGNLISGNNGDGIILRSGTGNTVKGNVIGLNIDGTQVGANDLGNSLVGVEILSSGNTVGGILMVGVDGKLTGDGNVISGNNNSGILIGAANNTIIGNIIGLDAKGTTAIGNGTVGANTDGIQLGTNASGNRIGTSSSTGVITAGEGNIISGNLRHGISFGAVNASSTNTGNIIQGNVIGLDISGTIDLGNSSSGINAGALTSAAILNNQIGGAGYLTKNANGQFVGAGNLISGNNADGIFLGANFNQNKIQGNIIGLDITGKVDLGNTSDGIDISSSNNKIGNDGIGSDVGEGNLISGNNVDGIFLRSGTGNTVKGNVIGLNIDGTQVGANDLGNSLVGIEIFSSGNTVGGILMVGVDGKLTGDGNVISGNNNSGILISAANNTIIGNIIGLDATGTTAIGNGTVGANTDGIQLGTNASGNRIGTSSSTGVITAGEGNIISGNLRHGISFGATNSSTTNTGNIIQGNVIGLDISGTIDLGNVGSGINASSLGSNAVIFNNQIGGAGYLTKNANGQFVGAGNLISGNNVDGISIAANFNQNKIQGNIIGLDITGKVDLGNNSDGMDISSANNIIGNDGIGNDVGEGNLISGNSVDGIILRSSATGTTVKGNVIGLNIDGTQVGANDLGNTSNGVEIQSSGNTLGGILVVGVDGKLTGDGNVISGNNSNGIFVVLSTATNNTVIGNIIGLDATGKIAIGNSSSGIQLSTSANNNRIGTSSSTGVITAGEGNIISGNIRHGIETTTSPTGNLIQGNVIGLDISGTIDLGNTLSGVIIISPNNIVGGSGLLTKNLSGQFVGAGNLISGNNNDGILLGSTGTGTIIKGNIIGLDITGTIDLGNSLNGVEIQSTGNTVGGILMVGVDGKLTGAGNVISGNDSRGIVLSAANNTIIGNIIGLDVTGTIDRGNTSEGIQISASNNRIGTSSSTGVFTAGEGNIISGNNSNGINIISTSATGNRIQGNTIGLDITGTLSLGNNLSGVRLSVAATGNTISRNSIFGNGGLGIDLIPIGATPNDSGDGDAGANLLQNYPVLSSANFNAGMLTITGWINTAPGTYNLEFFANSIADSTGFGEGQFYLGSQTITVSSSSVNTFFTYTFAPLVTPLSSYTYSSTATDSLGNTSEFSHFDQGAAPVNLTTPPSGVGGNEDSNILLNINASLTDQDGSETLVINITGVPTGAMLSNGSNLGGGNWQLTPAQLAGLTVTPPLNSGNDFTLSITATSTESNGGNTSSATATLFVDVTPVADTPNLSVMNATGNEDSAIALNISSSLNDLDGSETLVIDITGVPAGAMLSAGTDMGGGYWQLTPAQLAGLTVTPASNSGDDFTLSVTATSTDGTSTATTLAQSLFVDVTPVADTPNLSVMNTAGNEDSAIALNISSSLNDLDGSETLVIDINFVPAGAMLSQGTDMGGGHWQLTPAQLAGLTVTPASNSGDDFTLSVTATSTDGTSTATTLAQSLFVDVTPVADMPTLSVPPSVVGLDHVPTPLNISSTLFDRDGSESLTITISGVPIGATLSNGFVDMGGGVWVLAGITPSTDATALSGLTITTPLTFDGSYSLHIVATATEAGGYGSASRSADMNVFVKSRLWGIDKADNQLFSIGDYTNAAATFTDFGTLRYNGQAINGVIESFALQGTKGYFVINSFNAPGHSLNGRDVLAMVDITQVVAGGPNGVTLLGEVNVPIGHRISGLAINPLSGDLYAVQKRGNDTGAGQDSLLVISKTDGHILTDVGKMMGLNEKSSVTEDLKFDNAGNLFVTDDYDDKTYKICAANGAIMCTVDNNQAGGLAGPVHFTAMAFDSYANAMIALDDNSDSLVYGITDTNGSNTAFANLGVLGLTSIGGMDFSQ